MKSKFSKLAAMAIAAMTAQIDASAQSDLGASCGCPAVGSRTEVLLSSLAVSGGATDGDLTATNTILTCNKTYILDKKIYVPEGKTLTIAPGTLIKGRNTGDPLTANALIVSRGAKVFASGTESCPIVFTAEEDPMDGTYAMTNKGKWGGIVVLGKASNNLTASNVGSGRFGVSAGIGFVEGYASAEARNQYGAAPGSEDDDDNSGILSYISIRHAGATIGLGNELNGLTLASVGRGTTIDHIEIIANDDDGIEFFGGTVNVKYISAMFGNDDMFDWDLGWRGKAQFLFGIQLSQTQIAGSDNGFESDNDDQKTNATPKSHPIIYNATFIGNGNFATTPTGGASGPAAIQGKEATEGEIYSSIFANFKSGFNLVKSLGTRTGSVEAYHNWTGVDNSGNTIPQTLKVQCNTFIANQNALTVGMSKANLVAGDSTRFADDGNVVTSAVTGFDYTFAGSGSTVTDQYNAVPNPALSTSCQAPADGFFTPVNYRGAFKPGETSWLSNWAYAKLIAATKGLVPCKTDITGDGTTNVNDFLDLVGKFGQSCD